MHRSIRSLPSTRLTLCLVPFAAALFMTQAPTPVSAQGTDRARPTSGPIIKSGGPAYAVPSPTFEVSADTEFRVVFEVVEGSQRPERAAPGFGSMARFLNMHGAAGVPVERLHVAAVVHGTAGKALLSDDAYREEFGTANPNAAMIRELTEAGARIVLCGQTAAARGIDTDRLLPGVQVSLSAMTALFVLQEEGYRVNLW